MYLEDKVNQALNKVNQALDELAEIKALLRNFPERITVLQSPPPPPKPKDILNLKEVAEYLSLSENSIYRLRKEKKIPCFQPEGGKLLFKRSVIDKWVEQGYEYTKNDFEKIADAYCSNNPLKSKFKI